MPEIVGESVKLYDGHLMPLLGLGCWQSTDAEVESAVETALNYGYRHIDTAYMYKNETGVGSGIANWLKKSGKERKDVYVVTKLPMIAMYPELVEEFMRMSLKNLKLDFVDLFLIHLPMGLKRQKDIKNVYPRIAAGGKVDIDCSTDHIAIWKEMERMVDLGLAKSIGVSNFNIRQIKKLNAISRIRPAVNQVEMQVNFQQRPLQEFCNKENIILTAYGPLGSPGRDKNPNSNTRPIAALLDHPVVTLVANNHKVSTAQVLIRFWIQQGVVCIPKSVTPSRIKSNGEVFGFKLSEVEIEALKFLDRGEEGRAFNFINQNGYGEHPECPAPLN